jgi:hypothetical protein
MCMILVLILILFSFKLKGQLELQCVTTVIANPPCSLRILKGQLTAFL